MKFTSAQHDDGVVERAFTLDGIPGILWTPESRTAPVPLVLLSGGPIAIGIRLAVVEPRITAAVLFAGSFVPAAMFDEARQVTIPLQVLLQWDDEMNDRQATLNLFDAFGSEEKALHANMGGHAGVPQSEVTGGARFFARHSS